MTGTTHWQLKSAEIVVSEDESRVHATRTPVETLNLFFQDLRVQAHPAALASSRDHWLL